MKQVCVLGNGQLGRMLRQAGEPLGIAVWPVGLDAEPAAVPFQQSVITAEIERWPETALTRELARHPAFVPFAEIIVTKNRFGSLGTVYQRFCNGHFVACDQDEARQICTASNAPAARGRRYAQGADV